MKSQEALATAEWLVGRGLLKADEVAVFRSTSRLPRDFPSRVLNGSPAAVPITVTDSVDSHGVLVVERFTPPDPPILTYDGPLPPEYQFGEIPQYTVMVHDVQGGKMFVGSGLSTLILDEGHYFLDLSCSHSKWIAPAFAEAPVDVPLKGTAAVLFVDGATFYGHWMFDLLPKFHVLGRAGWPDEAVDHYVVNATTAAFSDESLARLGIPREKLVYVSGRVISADRLLVPSRVRRRFRAPDWAREFVVSLFLRKTEGRRHEAMNERIYISRAHARRRRVINEAEVNVFLEGRGFRTVFAENMPISELAEIVGRSGWIVTPHGAGITNVAFARPGVRVLEFFGAHIVPEGWLMTRAVGGSHYLLAGRDQSGGYSCLHPDRDSVRKTVRNTADYAVDVDDLSHALALMASE